LLGQSFPTDAIQGEISAGGDLTAPLQFGAEDLFIAMNMGACAVYYQEETLIDSGTSTAGDTTSLTDTGATWTIDALIGKFLVIRSGTGAYQVATITDNTGTVLTFAAMNTLGADSVYEICEYAPSDLGIATSSDSTSLTDSAKTFSVDALIGKWIMIVEGTGVGSGGKIIDNDATSITIGNGATWTLDGTSKYEISGDTTRKVHTFADNTDGHFCTGLKKGASVYIDEFPSVKFTGFTIRNTVGKVPELVLKTIADRLEDDSAINTTSTFTDALVTIREDANLAVFKGEDANGIGVFVRMRDVDDTELDSGDNIDVKDLELSFEPDYQGQYLLSGGDLVDEPSRTKINPGMLKCTFPRLTATQKAYWAEWDAGTNKKMIISYVGNLITNVNRSIVIEIPNLEYASLDKPTTTGIIEVPAEFLALARSTASAGMPGVTKPFRITTVNGYGGNPLLLGN
jgi:hypothetical protein